jgi:NTP pyrophosphatase (non-canonical NTP hydrolase)
VISPEFKESVKRELGDVLWYLAVLAKTLDFSLEDVAVANIEKVRDREARGVIKSQGDTR